MLTKIIGAGSGLLFFASISLAQNQPDVEKLAFENHSLATLSEAASTKTELRDFTHIGDAVEVLGASATVKELAHQRDFDAQIYREKGTDNFFLVYRGSNGFRDWHDNIQQLSGRRTVQHNTVSPYIAELARQKYPKITCVGHSLGGANATVGCGPLGLRVVTFNPASLNLPNSVIARNANSLNIRFTMDFAGAWPGKLVGTTVNLPQPSWNRLKTHYVETMAAELQRISIGYERRMLTESVKEAGPVTDRTLVPIVGKRGIRLASIEDDTGKHIQTNEECWPVETFEEIKRNLYDDFGKFSGENGTPDCAVVDESVTTSTATKILQCPWLEGQPWKVGITIAPDGTVTLLNSDENGINTTMIYSGCVVEPSDCSEQARAARTMSGLAQDEQCVGQVQ